MTSYRLVYKYQHFGKVCCFDFQGIQEICRQQALPKSLCLNTNLHDVISHYVGIFLSNADTTSHLVTSCVRISQSSLLSCTSCPNDVHCNISHVQGSRVLPEKPTGPQLVKKFPALYGIPRFNTAFTTARLQSPSWARSIYAMPHSTLRISLLISSFHLYLGLSSCLLPSDFSAKTLYAPLISPIRGDGQGTARQNRDKPRQVHVS